MSQNNEIVEACRLAFSGFEKNDKSKLLALLADDVVFEFPKSLPYGGRYKGVTEFKAIWADLYENYYEHFNYDALDVLDAGSHVIVPVVAHASQKRQIQGKPALLPLQDGERTCCPSSNDLRLLGLWKNGVSGSVCGLI
jgi:ketosteroid isomerase-like protein